MKNLFLLCALTALTATVALPQETTAAGFLPYSNGTLAAVAAASLLVTPSFFIVGDVMLTTEFSFYRPIRDTLKDKIVKSANNLKDFYGSMISLPLTAVQAIRLFWHSRNTEKVNSIDMPGKLYGLQGLIGFTSLLLGMAGGVTTAVALFGLIDNALSN